MSRLSDFYQLLGLPKDATSQEIQAAYREVARKLHPDTRDAQTHTELFLEVQEAYEVLSDPKKREQYNQQLEHEIIPSRPVLIDIIYSRSKLIRIDEPQIMYTLLELTPQVSDEQPNTPINACLVIDRSTSMQGERMDTVKTTAIEILHKLDEHDTLSVITFSDRAEVIVPSRGNMSPSMMESQIRMIHPSGGTEIFQGLNAGFQEIHKNLHKTPINHIFLLTDGRTYGDEDACIELANRAAEVGVSITGLGIGNDWNDILIDELATCTGGSSLYISKPRDIRTILEDQFKNLESTLAEKVQLNVDNSPGVQLHSAYRLQPDSSEIKPGSQLRLGNLTKSSHLTVLLEFIVPPITQFTSRFTMANGMLSMIVSTDPHTPQTFTIRFSRPIGEEFDTELPPKPISKALSLITLFRMQNLAQKDVKDGKIIEASQRLELLASQLHSIGEEKLGETALIEARRIQETNMLSTVGLKQIKYGTRALLLPKLT